MERREGRDRLVECPFPTEQRAPDPAALERLRRRDDRQHQVDEYGERGGREPADREEAERPPAAGGERRSESERVSQRIDRLGPWPDGPLRFAREVSYDCSGGHAKSFDAEVQDEPRKEHKQVDRGTVPWPRGQIIALRQPEEHGTLAGPVSPDGGIVLVAEHVGG